LTEPDTPKESTKKLKEEETKTKERGLKGKTANEQTKEEGEEEQQCSSTPDLATPK